MLKPLTELSTKFKELIQRIDEVLSSETIDKLFKEERGVHSIRFGVAWTFEKTFKYVHISVYLNRFRFSFVDSSGDVKEIELEFDKEPLKEINVVSIGIEDSLITLRLENGQFKESSLTVPISNVYSLALEFIKYLREKEGRFELFIKIN